MRTTTKEFESFTSLKINLEKSPIRARGMERDKLMHTYKEQKFNIGTLQGISPKQLEVHLGLYAGYVKHVELIREKIRELKKEDEQKHLYTIAELRRRFSFEFNGMRMHEYYFEQFENGALPANELSSLFTSVSKKYGSWEKFVEHLKIVGMSRGIGWTVLSLDNKENEPHVTWVGDHELGVLAGLPVILALDMWEHAYMVDYTPKEKSNYIDAFFKNLNWRVIEGRFEKSQ